VQPTVLLAAAAEAQGIPTAVLCTDQVISLAAVCASFVMPGLPVLLLATDRLSGAEGLARAARAVSGEVVQAFTASGDELRDLARRRFPAAQGLARGDGDATAHASFTEFAQAARFADGLPLVAPTRERVDAMLQAARRDPEETLTERMAPSGAALTVRQAASCAVMAGCTPQRFTFVLAALEAMAKPEYELHLATITTHPGAHLLVFSGAQAHAAGIASGRGCMGPGYAANVTIGRAVTLVLIAVARAVPGLSLLASFSSPAQLTQCCFADIEAGSLPPLHAELDSADSTIAWVFKCESPHNVVDHLSQTPESLLVTIADTAATLGGNGTYLPGDLLVVMNPEHARLCVQAGWGRQRIREFLWQEARVPRARLEGRGVKGEWPAEWAGWARVPVAKSPDRIWIVEAGGAAPQSMVGIPWGYNRTAWARLRDANCVRPSSHL
jgi:hypothetical protein